MVSAVDHPLNEKGYRQAKALQMALAAAAADPAGDGPASAAEAAALHAMFNAGALWASPLTRALQTAIVGLQPLLQADGAPPLELKANAREKKNFGGRDTIGTVCGDECGARALGKLTQLLGAEEAAAELPALKSVALETTEVEEPWWVTGVENKQQVSARVAEFIHQIEHSPHAAIVVVGHSHFFRSTFQRYLHPDVARRAAELDAKLREEVLPNCGVACCQFDFTRGPRMITDVRVLIAMPSPTGDFRLVMQRQQERSRGRRPPPLRRRARTDGAASHRS